MFCRVRPATRRMGWVYSLSNCSISASRMIGGPCSARTGSAMSAIAVTAAITRAAGAARCVLLGLLDPIMLAGLAAFSGASGGPQHVNAARITPDCGISTAGNVRINAATAGRNSCAAGGRLSVLDIARRLVTPSLRSEVPPFMVMDVMAAAGRIAEEGGRVIHMEVGQPAARPPTNAIEAARAALLSERLGYTETLGIPRLRARIAQHYRETYGIDIDAQRIAVTTGSSAAFTLAFLALFESGDRVAVALPGYPPYRHILSALGCKPVPIETTEATRWAITPDMLIAEHRKAPLKGVLIASPANPTGTMIPAPALRELIAAAESEGINFISDEIYHG